MRLEGPPVRARILGDIIQKLADIKHIPADSTRVLDYREVRLAMLVAAHSPGKGPTIEHMLAASSYVHHIRASVVNQGMLGWPSIALVLISLFDRSKTYRIDD